MNEEQFLTEDTSLDVKELIKLLKKRRYLILTCFFVAVVAATVISFLLPKTYEAGTTLRIKQPRGLADSLLGSMPMGDVLGTKQQMSTYAEILKSRTVIESMIATIYAGKNEADIPKYEEMLGRISTLPIRDTEILKVAVRAKTPVEAQSVANSLVQTFIDRMTYLARSEQTMVRKFIGDRLIEAKNELDQAEEKLEAYKRDQQIAAPEEETKAIVGQLSQINQLKAANAVELSASQAKLESARQQLENEKPGFIAENQLILQYKSKLADLEVQLVGMLQKYTDQHPEVLALRAAIDETKQRLNTEIARVVNSEASSLNPVHQGILQNKIQAEVEIAAATSQKEAIDKILASQESILSTLPAKEQGLVRAMRDANVAQQIYIMLAQRHEEARISEVMQPTDIQVIDRAVAPKANKPIKPNKKQNVMIAAFFGFLIGTGLAFVLEYFNKTINSADDIQTYLGLPVLGRIPVFNSEGKKRGWLGRKGT